MLLHKLETTDYSCLVLPRTLTNRRHRFLCFLRAAQLPSQDCVCSPVLLVQYSRVHRSATSATVVFRGGKPAHRKVCWLANYACSHRGIHSVLRSQHCRKSEYLKPRITTYDSSCRLSIYELINFNSILIFGSSQLCKCLYVSTYKRAVL